MTPGGSLLIKHLKKKKTKYEKSSDTRNKLNGLTHDSSLFLDTAHV